MGRFSSKPNECRVKTGCWAPSVQYMSTMLFGTSIHLHTSRERHTHPHPHTHTHPTYTATPPHLAHPYYPCADRAFPSQVTRSALLLPAALSPCHNNLCHSTALWTKCTRSCFFSVFCFGMWRCRHRRTEQKWDEKRSKLVETQPPLWKIAGMCSNYRSPCLQIPLHPGTFILESVWGLCLLLTCCLCSFSFHWAWRGMFPPEAGWPSRYWL